VAHDRDLMIVAPIGLEVAGDLIMTEAIASMMEEVASTRDRRITPDLIWASPTTRDLTKGTAVKTTGLTKVQADTRGLTRALQVQLLDSINPQTIKGE